VQVQLLQQFIRLQMSAGCIVARTVTRHVLRSSTLRPSPLL